MDRVARSVRAGGARFLPGECRGPPLARRALRASMVHGRRNAVLAHGPDAARTARHVGADTLRRRCPHTRRRSLRARVAGRALRGARHGLRRVSGRVRRLAFSTGRACGCRLPSPACDALTAMRDAVYANAIVPPAVLGWQEEQTRFAFQNGQAAFMRNWPYARRSWPMSRSRRLPGASPWRRCRRQTAVRPPRRWEDRLLRSTRSATAQTRRTS